MGPFTTPDAVKQLIGTNHSTNQLETDRLAVIIQEVGETIYDAVSQFVVPFNSYTDDPPTPTVVKRACEHMAAAQAMREIGVQNQNAFLVSVQLEGNAMLEMLRNNRGHTQPNTVTGETLTFGDADPSWDLRTYEALMANSANPVASGDTPNIIPEGVAISSSSTTDGEFNAADAALMRNGDDFKVSYSSKYGAFLFRSMNTNIENHISTLKVDYPWNYRRNTPARQGVGVLFNG